METVRASFQKRGSGLLLGVALQSQDHRVEEEAGRPEQQDLHPQQKPSRLDFCAESAGTAGIPTPFPYSGSQLWLGLIDCFHQASFVSVPGLGYYVGPSVAARRRLTCCRHTERQGPQATHLKTIRTMSKSKLAAQEIKKRIFHNIDGKPTPNTMVARKERKVAWQGCQRL